MADNRKPRSRCRALGSDLRKGVKYGPIRGKLSLDYGKIVVRLGLGCGLVRLHWVRDLDGMADQCSVDIG